MRVTIDVADTPDVNVKYHRDRERQIQKQFSEARHFDNLEERQNELGNVRSR